MALKSMTEDMVCSTSTSTWERASAAALLVPLMCWMFEVNWAI